MHFHIIAVYFTGSEHTNETVGVVYNFLRLKRRTSICSSSSERRNSEQSGCMPIDAATCVECYNRRTTSDINLQQIICSIRLP